MHLLKKKKIGIVTKKTHETNFMSTKKKKYLTKNKTNFIIFVFNSTIFVYSLL